MWQQLSSDGMKHSFALLKREVPETPVDLSEPWRDLATDFRRVSRVAMRTMHDTFKPQSIFPRAYQRVGPSMVRDYNELRHAVILASRLMVIRSSGSCCLPD
ncbi:MAG: hypothetical protein R3C56_04670 [Pirellulaceae bacterium]